MKTDRANSERDSPDLTAGLAEVEPQTEPQHSNLEIVQALRQT
jgi:hypothetical protein